MANIFTIVEAWRIAKNPSKKQAELAVKRAEVCNVCPSKKIITKHLGEIGIICSECGCPIAKKVFTNIENPCPLKKWDKVDRKYFGDIKKTNSLI
jgi:hypothetical protein